MEPTSACKIERRSRLPRFLLPGRSQHGNSYTGGSSSSGNIELRACTLHAVAPLWSHETYGQVSPPPGTAGDVVSQDVRRVEQMYTPDMETPERNDHSDAEHDGQIALAAAFEAIASSRRLSETTLTIDLANEVDYQGDIGDPSQYATQPGITPATPPRNFFFVTLIADIVSVNGQSAKGTYIGRTRVLSLTPNPTGLPNAEAIADVTRTALREHIFEILQPNGTAIGTIMSLGFSGGPPPPGAPSTEHANWAIVGGTGAFLGARGTVGGTGGGGRAASMREDPKNRRTNGGMPNSFILHVIPMELPRVVELPLLGPAIYHVTNVPVSVQPAHTGDHLYLFATGLGPTVPPVELGQPFTPGCVVNSALSITVNGQPATVAGATGVQNQVDLYRVDFIVPSTAPGSVPVQVTAAWIKSPVVNMEVL